MDEYALAGKRLFHALKRRAVPPPIIYEACTEYLLSLSDTQRSANPVSHVLRFSTYILHHGHSKLGTVLKSTALANNVGCELVDKMTCTPHPNRVNSNTSANSEALKSVPSAATQVIPTDVDGPASVTNVKKKKPSRYARMKKKWISIQESDDEGKEFEQLQKQKQSAGTDAQEKRADAPLTTSVATPTVATVDSQCNLAVTPNERENEPKSPEWRDPATFTFEEMLGTPVPEVSVSDLLASKTKASMSVGKGSKIGKDANPPPITSDRPKRSASTKKQIVKPSKPVGTGKRKLAVTPKADPVSRKKTQKGISSQQLRNFIANPTRCDSDSCSSDGSDDYGEAFFS